MKKISPPEKNNFFASLSAKAKIRLLPQLELIAMERGNILYEPNQALHYIYFPIDSIIALIYVLESGASSEISLVGNEGIVGIFALLSNEPTCSQAWVMSAGYAYRIPKRVMQEECSDYTGDTLFLLFRYIQALITQLSLTAVCNRHHSIEQQFCRLLLLSLDRLSCNNLDMTQEMISNMLGVRREGVTEAAGKLQKLGIINYCRGHITILNRRTLEQLTCECYAVIKKETDRLLPNTFSNNLPLNNFIPKNSNCASCIKLVKGSHLKKTISRQFYTEIP